ncbi:hypothetical protein [Thermomonospora umbrina]|uniref:Uncharacterized protein n=1 Tax=Thermomonospora umbrina TaxID=111806 RepID=A0A3D9SSZ1_9ACTN|nr:hypothetical protein [Thermomonospora umbrina]REE95684.1 hypothetical protein DFJ69_1093 [Thermomonospora umbrina]
MTTRRVVAMILSAVGTVAVLALLFGNQWFNRWVADGDRGSDPGVVGELLRALRFPAWRIAAGEPASVQVAADFALLVLIAASALLILAGTRSLPADRGFTALVLGWWATFVSAGLAGLVHGGLLSTTDHVVHPPGGSVAVAVMANGAMFGLLYGWLPGLAVFLAFHLTRPRHGMAPMPAHAHADPGTLPADHPAARPYVLAGQQQPPPPGGTGWAPPPPSPGAHPTGGFPFPPTPPAGYAPPVVHRPPAPPAPPALPTGIAAAQPIQPPPAPSPSPSPDDETPPAPTDEGTPSAPAETAGESSVPVPVDEGTPSASASADEEGVPEGGPVGDGDPAGGEGEGERPLAPPV